ncbi:MAG: LysM peptidoglycan-binding domain-containing protein [Eubacterium sp.]|jgi:nucleoid-associated protein YgaU|nr:LysM peptidoglycan-binding domain-containing protein [Eubacterium sp.]
MYDVYLDGIRLPVTPQAILTRNKNLNRVAMLLNEGEINIIKSPGLCSFSFSALVPQKEYPFALYPDGFKGATFYLELLNRLKRGDKEKSAKPFWFTVSRSGSAGNNEFLHTDVEVTLENYTIKEEADNGMDIIVEIELLQYTEFGTVEYEKTEKNLLKKQTVRKTDDKPKFKTHKVVLGEYLWLIAQRYLGDGNRYREIYILNKTMIDERNKGTNYPTYTIYAGQELVLP